MSEIKSEIISNFRKSKFIQATFLVSTTIVFSVIFLFDQYFLQQKRTSVQKITGSYVSHIRNDLNQSLSAAYPLAALIRKQHGDTTGFVELATEMLPLYSGVSALQLQPEGILKHVVPLKGNEGAIGHNIFLNPVRNKEAFLARDTGKQTLAGPFNLIQGGVGAAARLPIYLESPEGKQFWGFSTVLIKFPDVLNPAKLPTLVDEGIGYQLTRIHPDTGKIQIISSSNTPLIDEPESFNIEVPNSTWTFQAYPINGWRDYSTFIYGGLLGLLFILLATLASFLFVRLKYNNQNLETLVLERTKELSDSHEQLKLSARVFSDTHEGIIITGADKRIVNVNPSFCKITGYSQDEVIGQNPSILSSGKQSKEFYQCMWQEISEQGHWQGEVWNRKKGGEIYAELLIISMLKDEFDNVVNYVGVFSDITQQKEQQVQLQRAQKMDALGKLVGGIAHDYNNMLGVVLGYTDLMKIKFSTVDGLAKYIDNIAQAGERGRKLTQRMLNFSKKESSGAECTSINDILNSQKDLLSKSITALIPIRYDLSQSDWLVWVDSSEFEDMLLNMSINAQHAMVDGGSLTFTTQTVHLGAAEAKFLDLAKNDYLKLTIRDTGCGMSDELMSKIFDPFFSTKRSQGTGLGLSQVYGFMERSGGAVKVHSELGVGSEFSFYFPRYQGGNDNETEQEVSALERVQGDGETILVVDDEPALRNVAAEMLRLAGYRVLMASDGDEALDILGSHSVDLVLSDVIMPYMDGYQLAKRIERLYPEVKVQLASGYSDNRHIEAGNVQLHKTLLNKPYSSFELMSRISQLLAKNE